MEDQIKQALADGPKSVAEVAKATGKSESTVRKNLKALEEAGAVTKTGSKYGIADVPAPTEGESRGRGRPKDPFVQARDNRVLEAITASGETGLTTASLAEQLDITKNEAYISVWRLKHDGKVAKVLNGTRQPAYAASGNVKAA